MAIVTVASQFVQSVIRSEISIIPVAIGVMLFIGLASEIVKSTTKRMQDQEDLSTIFFIIIGGFATVLFLGIILVRIANYFGWLPS